MRELVLYEQRVIRYSNLWWYTQIYYTGYCKRATQPAFGWYYSEGVRFAYKLPVGSCESLQDKAANILEHSLKQSNDRKNIWFMKLLASVAFVHPSIFHTKFQCFTKTQKIPYLQLYHIGEYQSIDNSISITFEDKYYLLSNNIYLQK